MAEESAGANTAAEHPGVKEKTPAAPVEAAAPGPSRGIITDFNEIYGAEYADIVDPNFSGKRSPSVDDKMTGLALSGGGIRSASFCLGVLQPFNAAGILEKSRYLSTVSGAGYILPSITDTSSNRWT